LAIYLVCGTNNVVIQYIEDLMSGWVLRGINFGEDKFQLHSCQTLNIFLIRKVRNGTLSYH